MEITQFINIKYMLLCYCKFSQKIVHTIFIIFKKHNNEKKIDNTMSIFRIIE